MQWQRTEEFDAFGPWILEVRTVADLPRLFRKAGIDPEAHRLVLKVPRNIERRNANPDMHLYDHLIAVGDRALTVLHRREDTFDTVRTEYNRIVAIQDSVSFLDGRLTVHLFHGETISIPYNGASMEVVWQLIRELRCLYLPAAPEVEASVPGRQLRLGDADTGLVTLYRNLLRQEPHLRLVGSSARRTVTFTGRRALWRALLWAWPTTLHASIVVTDGREVQVLHRREWITRGRGDVHSLARTVLPVAKIDDVRICPAGKYAEVREVDVRAGSVRLRFWAPDGPEADAFRMPFNRTHAATPPRSTPTTRPS